MKKFFVLSILLLLTVCCYSQDYRKNRKEAEKYKADAGYYCGDSGECKNLKKADDAALNSLLETISNDKSLEYLYFVDSDSDDDEQRAKALVTFRDDLKKQSHDLVLNDSDGSAQVLRYISKDNFQK